MSVIDKKLQLLDQLLEQGNISQEMYDLNKSKVVNSLKDIPAEIAATGGYRKQFEAAPETASTLSDLINKVKEKGGAVTNSADMVKSTPSDLIGIESKVANKARFPEIMDRLKSGIPSTEKIVDNAGNIVNEEGSLLKNSKGFSKVLPALGLGAAALGGLSVANKIKNGEYKDAALQATDLGTDLIPGVLEAKLAYQTGKKALGVENLGADDNVEGLQPFNPNKERDDRFKKLTGKFSP
jgi:hypothetical protein